MTDFLGVGWSFPVCVDARGRIALARGERDIEQAIRMILMTPVGQRIMRPEFGCRIHEYLFASADGETASAIGAEVRASLRRWEPRIDVEDVVVTIDRVSPALLYIDVRYVIKATNDRRNLVFPFYVIPGGD